MLPTPFYATLSSTRPFSIFLLFPYSSSTAPLPSLPYPPPILSPSPHSTHSTHSLLACFLTCLLTNAPLLSPTLGRLPPRTPPRILPPQQHVPACGTAVDDVVGAGGDCAVVEYGDGWGGGVLFACCGGVWEL